MSQSVAERKKAERERKRAAGLVPVEVWIPAEKKSELAQAVSDLFMDRKIAAVSKLV